MIGHMTVLGGPREPTPGESGESYDIDATAATASLPAAAEPTTVATAAVEAGAVKGTAKVGAPKASDTPYRAGSGAPAPAGQAVPLTRVDRLRLWVGRHKVLVSVVALALVLSGAGVVVGGYYFDSVPTPDQLALPESTTVYFADGTTPMAKLGSENRTLLTYDEMNDAVPDS